MLGVEVGGARVQIILGYIEVSIGLHKTVSNTKNKIKINKTIYIWCVCVTHTFNCNQYTFNL